MYSSIHIIRVLYHYTYVLLPLGFIYFVISLPVYLFILTNMKKTLDRLTKENTYIVMKVY